MKKITLILATVIIMITSCKKEDVNPFENTGWTKKLHETTMLVRFNTGFNFYMVIIDKNNSSIVNEEGIYYLQNGDAIMKYHNTEYAICKAVIDGDLLFVTNLSTDEKIILKRQ